jgi:hypothetical protein
MISVILKLEMSTITELSFLSEANAVRVCQTESLRKEDAELLDPLNARGGPV